MQIIKKVRKFMEKYTGITPKPTPPKPPVDFTTASTRKKQGEGFWQADIGDKKPRVVDGKGEHSPAKPL